MIAAAVLFILLLVRLFQMRALLGHEFLIMGNFVVQPFHGGLELFVLFLEAGTLFHQDILAGFFRAFLEV